MIMAVGVIVVVVVVIVVTVTMVFDRGDGGGRGRGCMTVVMSSVSMRVGVRMAALDVSFRGAYTHGR